MNIYNRTIYSQNVNADAVDFHRRKVLLQQCFKNSQIHNYLHSESLFGDEETVGPWKNHQIMRKYLTSLCTLVYFCIDHGVWFPM